MPAVGIGREEELGRLLTAAKEAADGRGSIVFLAGPTGSGKSFLLKNLAARLADTDVDVLSVLCYEAGAGNPLGPFVEVLRALTNEHRGGERAKRILEIVGKVAPLVFQFIPGIGQLAGTVVKAGTDIGVYALGGHEEQQKELAADVAVALEHAAGEKPLVVVVDDAQWIDAASTEVILRLSDTAGAHPLLLLVSYDRDLCDDTHPLAVARAQAVGRGLATEVVLADLTADGVAAVLRDRYGEVPGPRLAEWLHDRTDGNLLFLQQYLGRLEEAGILRHDGEVWTLDGTIAGEPGDWSLGGRLAEAQTPDNLLELLRPRVAELDDDERSLLETGAVQGRRFLSTVLVRLLDREEDEVLDRLAKVAERRRMIEAQDVEDWWSDRSAQYTFDPGVLQELLYGRYAKSPYERRRRHQAVAQALEALVAEDHPPPRHAVLEIAWHFEQGGKPLEAAARLVEVADSTFAEGADRETGVHAARALELIRQAAPAQLTGDALTNAQRLLVRSILLLLLGGEASWIAASASGERERLVELAEEGERAAGELGDAKLQANALYAKAFVLTAYGGLEEALPVYQQALELARSAGDPLAEFAILVKYGHHMDSVDLHKGLELLQQAHELLLEGALSDVLDERQRAGQTALHESRLGIAEFDLGHYGEALDLLTRSSAALREFRARDEGAWSLAFLAQVHTAIGLYEAGEATLREAIGTFVDDARPLGVRGYLNALLGRLYLEWDVPKLDAAREVLRQAREETQAAGYRSVKPFAEIFWAELLLAEGSPEKLREADDVLAAATSYGWERSEITANSTRARIALAEGRTAAAVEHSTKAVTPLESRGGVVPTVRAEEIFFTHARVLEAAGRPGAERYTTEAARIVREKAESLRDPTHRDSYRSRVRLSRQILVAADLT
jgi:tetratricopeptide (TPR) repeat protein/energy-coupling factor transporter ATP-binding protein EcfA2